MTAFRRSELKAGDLPLTKDTRILQLCSSVTKRSSQVSVLYNYSFNNPTSASYVHGMKNIASHSLQDFFAQGDKGRGWGEKGTKQHAETESRRFLRKDFSTGYRCSCMISTNCKKAIIKPFGWPLIVY